MISTLWLSYDLGVNGDTKDCTLGLPTKVRRNVAPAWRILISSMKTSYSNP